MQKRRRCSKPYDEAVTYIRADSDKPDLSVRFINDFIGYGVFTTRKFYQGEFVCNYSGRLIEISEAEKLDDQTYLYYFESGSKRYCIDASDNSRIGRYLNDEPTKTANCVAKPLTVDGRPQVVIFTRKDIEANTELRYDYGVSDLPWRKGAVKKCTKIKKVERNKNAEPAGLSAIQALSDTSPTAVKCPCPSDGTIVDVTHSAKSYFVSKSSAVHTANDTRLSSFSLQSSVATISAVTTEVHSTESSSRISTFPSVPSVDEKIGDEKVDDVQSALPTIANFCISPIVESLESASSVIMETSLAQELNDLGIDGVHVGSSGVTNFPEITHIDKTKSASSVLTIWPEPSVGLEVNDAAFDAIHSALPAVNNSTNESISSVLTGSPMPLVIQKFGEAVVSDAHIASTGVNNCLVEMQVENLESALSLITVSLRPSVTQKVDLAIDDLHSASSVISNSSVNLEVDYSESTSSVLAGLLVPSVAEKDNVVGVVDVHLASSEARRVDDIGVNDAQLMSSEIANSSVTLTADYVESTSSAVTHPSLLSVTKEVAHGDVNKIASSFSTDSCLLECEVQHKKQHVNVRRYLAQMPARQRRSVNHTDSESDACDTDDDIIDSDYVPSDDGDTESHESSDRPDRLSNIKKTSRRHHGKRNGRLYDVSEVNINSESAGVVTINIDAIISSENNPQNGRSNELAGEPTSEQVTDAHRVNSDFFSTEAATVNVASKKGKPKKPPRPCPFCPKMIPRLQRHLKTVHKHEESVKKACSLPQKERNEEFKLLRRQGMYEYNKKQMCLPEPSLQRERCRKHTPSLVFCNQCHGFFSRRFFSRHSAICIGDRCKVPVAIPVSLLTEGQSKVSEEFRECILSKFHDDDVGQMCRLDEAIITVGCRMFDKMKRKKDKQKEVRDSVRLDMRRLAKLYIQFCKIRTEHGGAGLPNENASALLERANFDYLREAICRCTVDEGSDAAGGTLKAGLKNAYYYLIKRMAKIIRATYLVHNKDEEAEEISKFTEVLSLNYNLVFGDALYKTNMQRQIKLRRPDNLPKEADCQLLRDYTLRRFTELCGSSCSLWTSDNFIQLRDLLVCRLTLFNARRGGEPARLTLKQWEEAERNVWLTSDYVEGCDDVERKLFGHFKITYQSGKGNNHLVPILFPVDTIEPMRKLTDVGIRIAADINVTSQYVFASTKQSCEHVSGWHAVKRVARLAGCVSIDLVNATKMRHLISTLYAARDVDEKDRELFYKHMGHSNSVNQNVYQAPLVHQEITRVGRHLKDIDESKTGTLTTLNNSQHAECNSKWQMQETHVKKLDSEGQTRPFVQSASMAMPSPPASPSTSNYPATSEMSIVCPPSTEVILPTSSSTSRSCEHTEPPETDVHPLSPKSVKRLATSERGASLQLRCGSRPTRTSNGLHRSKKPRSTSRIAKLVPAARKTPSAAKSSPSASPSTSNYPVVSARSGVSVSSAAAVRPASSTETDVPRQNLLSAKTAKCSAVASERRAKRPRKTWSLEHRAKVTEYFSSWICGSGLPGKKDILPFVAANSEISNDWMEIRTKIMNEQNAAKKRLARNLSQLD